MTYAVLNTVTYLIKLVSFGRIVPVDEDYREYWTCMYPGPLPLPTQPTLLSPFL
jgi:AGZA family xanthine/uracil permease-like MFS transporter